MKTKSLVGRLLVIGAPVALGILIGFAWSQSLGQRALAEGAACKNAEAKEAACKKVQRFGAVIGLRPEKKDYYLKLHANTWPSVLEQIRKSNIQNYSIYMAELEGKLYLFAYFEYSGDDFKADMAKMARDPETQRWWKETDPCQFRLIGTEEGQQWLKMPEVFHTN